MTGIVDQFVETHEKVLTEFGPRSLPQLPHEIKFLDLLPRHISFVFKPIENSLKFRFCSLKEFLLHQRVQAPELMTADNNTFKTDKLFANLFLSRDSILSVLHIVLGQFPVNSINDAV